MKFLLIEDHAAHAPGLPDLVLLDLSLPRKDGLSVLAAAKAVRVWVAYLSQDRMGPGWLHHTGQSCT